jgi:2,4-dienoyl-CoA reductase-like NADH-dependent reductase (Old Yellow Enzyme family)
MRRDHYKIFSPGKIGSLSLKNRLVRSATWDPSVLQKRRMSEAVLELYGQVAAGGVGLVITGDFSAVPAGRLEEAHPDTIPCSYEDVRIEGFGRLVEAVRSAAPDCHIVAQVSADYPGLSPSDVASPYTTERLRPLSAEQIRAIVQCCAEAIAGVKRDGFVGAQLHAAHGGMLSRFLSPYTNRRDDAYGGSARNRARIVQEIVSAARERVGSFPILIKINGTDYVPGGTDLSSFSELAREVAQSGVDAIEISGGMWDCLVQGEEELGFPAVPSPESHTRLTSADKESYFLKYAENVALSVPVILVGGNRDVERLEAVVRQGKVDFVALCRPLIHEPDLPKRWLEGRGPIGARCISCNACLHYMITHLAKGEPQVATCVYRQDRRRVKEAQQWLSTWVERNRVG